MILRDAPEQFRQRLAAQGLALESLTPRAGLDAMVSFYREVRVEGCDLDDDGDMMLIEWGQQKKTKTKPAAFFFDVNRQLTYAEEDGEMWQLTLRFVFPLEASLKDIEADDHWVNSPGELDEEPEQLAELEAFEAVADRTDAHVSLVFDEQ